MLLKANESKKSDWIRNLAVVAVVSGLFVMTSYNMISGVMTQKQELRIGNIVSLVECMEEIDADSNSVYYCSDTEARYWSESFQFLLEERPLTVIESRQMDLEEDAFYFVGNKFLKTQEFAEDFYCVKKSNQFALVVLKDGELAVKAGLRKGE